MNLKDLRSTNVLAPIVYPLKNGDTYELGNEKIQEYINAFPNVDVYQELIKARMWNVDNPRKRKSLRGICKHLNAWLSNASQNQMKYQKCSDFGNGKDWMDEYV